MATVLNSRAAKCARRDLDEDEAPCHIPSAGELLIKQLAHKQTKTDISLEEQLKNEKKFEQGVGCVHLGEFSPGTSSLQEFKDRQMKAEKMKEFEGRGFTKDEVKRVLGQNKQSKASPLATSARNLHLQQIMASNPIRSEPYMSRREAELAASDKPDSMETRLYKFAMQNLRAAEQMTQEPPGHPVHSLRDMELALTQETAADPEKLAKTVRRKRRQLVDAMGPAVQVHFKPPEPNSSLWDCIEPPVIVPVPRTRRAVTCKRETFYTIENGSIVPVERIHKVCDKKEEKRQQKVAGQPFVALELPTKEMIFDNRLSEQEIRQLPRFKNYERGAVSKTLYLKNLSSNVTEDDLVLLFSKFHEHNQEKITFRLMTGKMRGQAFVTFKSCELATNALEEVNGVVVKGKPIIIQYGRNQAG